MPSTQKPIVLSVGGSLIVPDELDVSFLKRLKKLLVEEIGNGRRFVIITGGGKLSRRYQAAASTVSTLTPDDLDWLGVHATRLNGHLLRTLFRDVAHPVMITNPDDVLDVPTSAKLIVAAGYRPGASTDLRAVQIAEHVGAHSVINLSNIDYVYDKDPKKHEDAKPIRSIDWQSFRALLRADWDPGLNSPFEPVAAQEAERLGLEVVIMNGAKLSEVRKYLDGKKFVGTIVG